jgi:DNA invertase Pin-like site-specific DNA recombinase
MKAAKCVALYVRVSTTGQTVDNQIRELQNVAERSGWHVVGIFKDEGISGAKGRNERPAFDQMLKAVTRREVDMVAAWSVDRLGRSLQDLVPMLTDLHKVGCDLYLHQQSLDTSTPTGKAMFQMMGVFAEFEREMIRERINAGLARAKAAGRIGGRPPVTSDKEARVRELLRDGMGIVKVAKQVGVGTSVAQRIAAELKAVQ